MKQLTGRLQSIDVFRAITMLLMVFVNDVDGVQHIPEWIKHVDDNTDGLGFADTIFPAFLFIVGLSLPFAINNRWQKGERWYTIAWYIVSRSLALIIMGFFHVNLEEYNLDAAFPMPVWELSITLAFFLIWLDYSPSFSKTKRYILQGLGVAILVVMVIIYQGGETGPTHGMQSSWWGILGLIGWAYLTCALIYLVSKGRFWVQVAAAVFFFVFSLAYHMRLISTLNGLREYIWPGGNGAMCALVMGGVVVSCLYRRLYLAGRTTLFAWLLPLMAVVCIVLGFVVRPYDGISKVHDTPAWVAICTGISMLVFGFLIWLIDVQQKQQWFGLIKPAGTSTLTCYLLPYFLYAILYMADFKYPHLLNNGAGGILRSFALAFLLVLLTGWLEKRRLRLKI